ncbi:hypothetical protein F7725_020996 [Dissostichus mawsoni]|uniref:Guided entry of tail-anchored proteins factor 1 n=1 Tax=Dissostichus mawsoni TaxID=36200 RepID=A0A7J5YI65_DISMA|nr:hypothetical protein F7725_020996 [Dissostichus mawsoni]
MQQGGETNMAASYAWFLVLGSVFLVNLMKTLLPSISSFFSRLVQKDAEQESEMRSEVQEMKKEQISISMMDEFARYARLERKINKMTDKLKTHVKSRTAGQAKMKWVVNIVFYILQAALMVSLIWKYYADPVTVVPSKWIAPVERLVAFPTGLSRGPVQPEGELLSGQQAVVLAEQLQVLQTGLGAAQIDLCALELPGQTVPAGAGLTEQLLQDPGLVAVLGEDLGILLEVLQRHRVAVLEALQQPGLRPGCAQLLLQIHHAALQVPDAGGAGRLDPRLRNLGGLDRGQLQDVASVSIALLPESEEDLLHQALLPHTHLLICSYTLREEEQ